MRTAIDLTGHILLVLAFLSNVIPANSYSTVDRVFMVNEGIKVYYPATEEISSFVNSAAVVYAVAHDAVTETLY